MNVKQQWTYNTIYYPLQATGDGGQDSSGPNDYPKHEEHLLIP
jgi:hypothetical protein